MFKNIFILFLVTTILSNCSSQNLSNDGRIDLNELTFPIYYQSKGKVGVLNNFGVKISDCIYDKIEFLRINRKRSNDIVIVRSDKKTGLYSIKFQKEIIPAEIGKLISVNSQTENSAYEKIISETKSNVVRQDTLIEFQGYYFLKKNHDLIISACDDPFNRQHFDELNSSNKMVKPKNHIIRVHGLVSYMNCDKKTVFLDREYREIITVEPIIKTLFSNGSLLMQENQEYYIISTDGSFTSAKFKKIEFVSKNVFIGTKHIEGVTFFEIFNTDGVILERFKEGETTVLAGYIHRKQKNEPQVIYDNNIDIIDSITNGTFKACGTNIFKFEPKINRITISNYITNNVKFVESLVPVSCISEGTYKVVNKNGYSLYNRNNEIIYNSNANILSVRKVSNQFIIQTSKKIILASVSESIDSIENVESIDLFSNPSQIETQFLIGKDNKKGLVNHKLEILIPMKYKNIYPKTKFHKLFYVCYYNDGRVDIYDDEFASTKYMDVPNDRFIDNNTNVIHYPSGDSIENLFINGTSYTSKFKLLTKYKYLNEDYFIAVKESKFYILNKNLSNKIPETYSIKLKCGNYTEYIIENEFQQGIVRKDGSIIIKPNGIYNYEIISPGVINESSLNNTNLYVKNGKNNYDKRTLTKFRKIKNTSNSILEIGEFPLGLNKKYQIADSLGNPFFDGKIFSSIEHYKDLLFAKHFNADSTSVISLEGEVIFQANSELKAIRIPQTKSYSRFLYSTLGDSPNDIINYKGIVIGNNANPIVLSDSLQLTYWKKLDSKLFTLFDKNGNVLIHDFERIRIINTIKGELIIIEKNDQLIIYDVTIKKLKQIDLRGLSLYNSRLNGDRFMQFEISGNRNNYVFLDLLKLSFLWDI